MNASSTSVNSAMEVGADRFSAESHFALIHTQTWRSVVFSRGREAIRPSSSVMAARQSGCAASSAERLGMLASISGARSISAPLSSRVCSCARERFALKSTSAGMLPCAMAAIRFAYCVSSETACASMETPVSASMRGKNRLLAQSRSTVSVSSPVSVVAPAAPASRDRARDRERVFFKKLCIVRLRESIYRDYTILWLWRKGDAADGQGGLFARRPP